MIEIRVTKTSLFISVVVLATAIFVSSALSALANSEADVVYPVSELGGCKDEAECDAYCENFEHARECLDFADKHNLISDEEIAEGRKYLKILEKGGPGGCKDEASCSAYCEDINNLPECVDFIEKYGTVSDEELLKLKQIAAAIRRGIKPPGGCKDEASCFSYCTDDSNWRECVEFAEAAGFISGAEAAEARKFMPLILAGKTPGGCRTKEQCLEYCDRPENTVVCLEFALEQDLIEDPAEREEAEKVLPFLRAGTTPGGCKTKKQCEAYCDDDKNFKACIDFAEKAGFVSAEEAELARKAGGKGPGGCKSKKSCEEFCGKQEHRPECTQFAVKLGIMTQAEADQAANAGDFAECLEVAPPEIEACFITHLGAPVYAQLKAGVMPYDLSIIEKVKKAKECVTEHSSASFALLDDMVGKFPNVNACFERELGAGFVQRLKTGAVACGQIKGAMGKMTACFENTFFNDLRTCAAQDCSGFVSCMTDIQSKLPQGPAEEQSKEVKFPQDIQDKMNSCGLNVFGADACLDKPTCKEVVDCFSAMPKPPEGATMQEPPAEIKEKLDACIEVVQEEILVACTALPCAEFETCLKGDREQMEPPEGGEQKQFEMPPEVKVKFDQCAGEKFLACVPLPCKEFKACTGMDQQQEQPQTPQQGGEISFPDEVNTKLEQCNAEEQVEKWRACLPKSCDAFLDCVGYKEDGGGQSAEGEGGKKGPSMPADVDAKFKQCVNERNAVKQLACFDGRTCAQALACLGGGQKGEGGEGEIDPRVKAKIDACTPKQQGGQKQPQSQQPPMQPPPPQQPPMQPPPPQQPTEEFKPPESSFQPPPASFTPPPEFTPPPASTPPTSFLRRVLAFFFGD